VNLRHFLQDFFGRLHAEEIKFCVLRNHSGLPDTNVGSDIDLLVQDKDLERAIHLLASLPGLSVTDLASRPYVTSVFIHSVDRACLQVDLVSSLSWLGATILSVADVLDRAVPHERCEWILVPDVTDEAIVSFFSSYLVGGFIKSRYAPQYSPIFHSDPTAVEARIGDRISSALLRRVVLEVGRGNEAAALRELWPVRRSLLSRALARQPIGTVLRLLEHYFAELRVHFSGTNICTAAFFGPDGTGKSSVIEALQPRLSHCSKIIQVRHLRPRLPGLERLAPDLAPVVDPHGQPEKGKVKSHIQLILWLVAYWWDRLMRRKRNATLQIYDRYFHDVLVDPKRYRYGGSRAFARLLSRAVPRLDLAVFLDAPPEVPQARKQEVLPEETARQRQAYLDLARTLPNAHVVDAARPLEEVVAEAEAIVLRYIATRTARRLGLDEV